MTWERTISEDGTGYCENCYIDGVKDHYSQVHQYNDIPIVSIHTNDNAHLQRDFYNPVRWKRLKPTLTRNEMLRRLAESWGAPESWVLDQAVKLLYERCEGGEVELDRSRR